MANMERFPLQDAFLAALCQERVPVSIFLLNGIKIQGIIVAYDQFTVHLNRGASQLIYKNLIASVVPTRSVRN